MSAYLSSTLPSSLLVHYFFLMKKYWVESCKPQGCVLAAWWCAWTVKMRKEREEVLWERWERRHSFHAGGIVFYLLNWKTLKRKCVGGFVEECLTTVQNSKSWKCSTEMILLICALLLEFFISMSKMNIQYTSLVHQLVTVMIELITNKISNSKKRVEVRPLKEHSLTYCAWQMII